MTDVTMWEAITYDVWGNEDDGYEVNAAYTTGRIYEIDDYEDDDAIIKALTDGGEIYGDLDREDIDIDGDEHVLYINYKGWPAMELRRDDSPEYGPADRSVIN